MFGVSTIVYGVAVLGALVYARLRGVHGLLLATVFLIPWFGLMQDIGVTLNADRLVAVVLLVALLLKHRSKVLDGFTVFFVYGVAVTVAASVALPESTVLYTATKGQWRWLFQIPMWAIAIAPGAAAAHSDRETVIRDCGRAFVTSASVLALLGLIQFVVYYVTGTDLFPLGVFTGGERRFGAFRTSADSFLGGAVFRACALGGEPKHLGYSTMLCVTLLVIDRITGRPLELGKRASLLAVTANLAALVVTFSTQGYMLLGVNLAIVLVGAGVFQGLTRGQVRVVAGVVVATVLLLAIPGLSDVVVQRTVQRLSEKSTEDWNEAVWYWFSVTPSAWPLGVGFGNVHLHAAPYIPNEYLYYMAGNVFVAKAGLLRILTETGVIGLALFAWSFLKPILVLARRARSRESPALAVLLFVSAVMANYLVTNDGPTYVFWAIGLAVAEARAPAARAQAFEEEGANAVAASVHRHA